jgi:hypothetical protein
MDARNMFKKEMKADRADQTLHMLAQQVLFTSLAFFD